MGRNNGNKPSGSHRGASPIWTGILVGLLVGIGIAAGFTWYMMKTPRPFLQKEQITVRPPAEAAKPAEPAAKPPVGASTETGGKPRFEFYKVLTDKQDASVSVSPHSSDKHKGADKPKSTDKPAEHKPTYEPHLLQAGSFPKVDDAEKLKAKLALLGVEANIQSATIPDKGVWYRVRLGPYKNAEDLSRARTFLKQNGVDSTPMPAR